MVYTDEELGIMRENTKQIENYLHGLQPRIRESIHVEFGNTVVRRGDYGCRVYEKEFDLWVSKGDIFGGCGGLRYSFDPVDGYHCGLIDLYKNKVLGGNFMAALCGEWQRVKAAINQKINEQESKTAKIHSFVL